MKWFYHIILRRIAIETLSLKGRKEHTGKQDWWGNLTD
jgi:hypothetical protein